MAAHPLPPRRTGFYICWLQELGLIEGEVWHVLEFDLTRPDDFTPGKIKLTGKIATTLKSSTATGRVGEVRLVSAPTP